MQLPFSFTRLGLLIKKQWADHSRIYALAIIAVFGLMAIALYLWSISRNQDPESSYVILFVGLFVSGSIFASMTFADLSQRTTGIYWLSVPATHAEKLVCGIIYTQVFFNALVVASFFILQPIFVSMASADQHTVMRFHDAPARAEFDRVMFYISLGYLAVQTLFLLGSVYFQRFAFIKTVVSVLVVMLLFFLFMRYLILPGFPEHGHIEGDVNGVQENGPYGYQISYSFPDWLISTLKFAVKYIWAPVFWVATYFRLKEKEI